MEDNLQSAVDENPDTAEVMAEPPDTAAPPEESDAAAVSAAEREQLAQQNAELQSRYLRLQADFENYRKRTERERMEFAEYAGEQTVRELLPILDDFERALDAASNHGTVSDEFVRGLELIYTRMMDTLKKQGLEPIDTEGAMFDPHQHQGVQRIESDEHEEGAIVRELQRGYNFKGRLLRPSMVQVAVKP
jgi:molecular chaperone GrpE